MQSTVTSRCQMQQAHFAPHPIGPPAALAVCWSSRALFILVFVAPSFPQLLTPPAQSLPEHSSHSLQCWCPHAQEGPVCNPPFFTLLINPKVATTGAWVLKTSYMQMIPKSSLISPLNWRRQLLSDDEGASRFTLNSTRLKRRTSLVGQCLGVHLVIQGTLVWSPPGRVPHVPEQRGLCTESPCFSAGEAAAERGLCTEVEGSCRRAASKSLCAQETSTAEDSLINQTHSSHCLLLWPQPLHLPLFTIS